MSYLLSMLFFTIVGVIAGRCTANYNLSDLILNKHKEIIQLYQLGFFDKWLADCSGGLFGWCDDLKDYQFGNYEFRYVLFKVTGRRASRFQIEKNIRDYAFFYNYNAQFFVDIKKEEDYELIRIVYIMPELNNQYLEYCSKKKQLKTSAEYEKEKEKRIFESVGKAGIVERKRSDSSTRQQHT